jgi:hypothetical protein
MAAARIKRDALTPDSRAFMTQFSVNIAPAVIVVGGGVHCSNALGQNRHRRARGAAAHDRTLGYSRMTFVRFVTDETWPTVKACLEAAFGYFGGVPHEALFDNMKTVVLERNAYGRGQHRLDPGLLALSRDLGFAVRLCRPYRAKTKGKVERFNRYLRDCFYNPLVTRLQSHVPLDATTANVEVLRLCSSLSVICATGTPPTVRTIARMRPHVS